MRYDKSKTLEQNFANLLNSKALFPHIQPNHFVLADPTTITPGAGNGNSNTSMVISTNDGSGNPINPTTTVYYNRRSLRDMRNGMPLTLYVNSATTVAQVRAEILSRFNLPSEGVVIFDPLEGMPMPGDDTVFYVTPVAKSKIFQALSTIGIRVVNTETPAPLSLGLTPTQVFGAPSFQRNGRDVWVLNSRSAPTSDLSTTPRYLRSSTGPRYMRILADEKAARSDFKFRNRPEAITFGTPTAGTQSGFTGNTFIDFEIGDGSIITGYGTFLYTRFDMPGTSNSHRTINAPLHIQQIPTDAVISRNAYFDYYGLPGEDNFAWVWVTASLKLYDFAPAANSYAFIDGARSGIEPLPVI